FRCGVLSCRQFELQVIRRHASVCRGDETSKSAIINECHVRVWGDWSVPRIKFDGIDGVPSGLGRFQSGIYFAREIEAPTNERQHQESDQHPSPKPHGAKWPLTRVWTPHEAQQIHFGLQWRAA